MNNTSSVSITDTGATKDSLCTAAIQAAIDRAAENQGTVFVPAGRFISGMLELRSGITLMLHPDAILQASGDMQDFPERGRNVPFQNQRHHFILAENCRNVTICGGGTLDGNGPAFWEPQTAPDTWIKAKRPRVSPMLEFRYCQNLTLDNVKIVNSPGWTVHPYCCDNVTLRNVSLDNNLYGPNTDGFDINGCHDVTISDCRLSCGDDGIIIKATKNARSSERIAISNCIVRSNCIGIGLGQETESNIRQVTVSNCVVYQSNRIFSIGIWGGGTVEDVLVQGLVGDTLCKPNLSRVIHLEVKQHVGWDVPLGKMRNIMISNVISRGAGRCLIGAQKGTTIDDVVMRDIRMDFSHLEDADVLSPADGATGSSQYFNQNLEARRQNAAVVLENLRRFALDGLHVTWPEEAETIPYNLVWASSVQDAVLQAPFAQGYAGAEKFVINNSHNVKT